MSLSPSMSSENGSHKRRRTEDMSMGGQQQSQQQQQGGHIPKRGARACTACRKGKNRCEGEAPCRRCQLSGTQCVFEKPEKKNVQQPIQGSGVERVARLEGQYLVMQSHMIGMQSTLERILTAVSHPRPTFSSPQPSASLQQRTNGHGYEERRSFPPLPGFAPPPHKYATYGIVSSTAPSSDDESEDTLPRAIMDAPIEALQGLANAAAEAAAVPSARVKKRKRTEPTPRNAFPHVVEKGLVTDQEARELYNIFFAGCHLFIPVFDPTYDTYESLMERTPWTFDAILAVAGKIRSGNGPLSPTFYKCLEEAQGIARSSLFGPVVRKEAVQGMLLLAAWSTNGWLPSGHAMRMALDLGLHRALEKLAVPDDPNVPKTPRSSDEERNLIVSARIWLCLYWFDHQMSLGTGRPIVLRDESSIRHCRVLLNHPMTSPTDVRLISQVELIAQKTQIYETLSPLNGHVNHSTLAFIRRANMALDKWYAESEELHIQAGLADDQSLLRKILYGELQYAKLWLVCVALRGVAWDKMPFEQREMAFQAKDAATACLEIFLSSGEYRAALRYAVHDSLVTAAFSGLFLLKMATLFPAELDLSAITSQVEQLAQLLSEVAAERYALTLRIMLANLRRKVGLASGISTPLPTMIPPQVFTDMLLMQGSSDFHPQDPSLPPPFTMEELGFAWPPGHSPHSTSSSSSHPAHPGHVSGIVSPAAIPLWLQEQSLGDLGLPVNGSDGIFLNMNWASQGAPAGQSQWGGWGDFGGGGPEAW